MNLIQKKKRVILKKKKKNEYCYYGVIEASVKCINEDGTAVANLEVNNVDAIYNLL